MTRVRLVGESQVFGMSACSELLPRCQAVSTSARMFRAHERTRLPAGKIVRMADDIEWIHNSLTVATSLTRLSRIASHISRADADHAAHDCARYWR